MARTFRRDSQGRFARTGGAGGKVGKTVRTRQKTRAATRRATAVAQMRERAMKAGRRGAIIQNLR
jgi:hypothetical protein